MRRKTFFPFNSGERKIAERNMEEEGERYLSHQLSALFKGMARVKIQHKRNRLK